MLCSPLTMCAFACIPLLAVRASGSGTSGGELEFKYTISGTLAEPFQLSLFPFDTQTLTITLSTAIPASNIRFRRRGEPSPEDDSSGSSSSGSNSGSNSGISSGGGGNGGVANNASEETCESLLIKPNAWPAADVDTPSSAGLDDTWRRVMLQFLEDCIQLTDTLGVAFSNAMGRDPALIAGLAKGGEDISLMRLFHYFAPTHAPALWPGVPRTGSSPHTDWHLMTIILQDTTGGLQVRRPSPPYDWMDVPAVEGELIVIVGDYLGALSDGRFISPVHRVLLPEAPQERYSFTYFRYPHCAATVPPANARRAESRAARRNLELRRHAAAAAEPFNTLVAPAPEGEGLEKLAARPFGELLLDKWRGVASNKR